VCELGVLVNVAGFFIMAVCRNFFLSIVLSCVVCLWHGGVHAMKANSKEASAETTSFVRSILQELDVKNSGTVLILHSCNEPKAEDDITLAAQLDDHAFVPRYVWTNKEEEFARLSEGQKRFLVARVVMAAKYGSSPVVVAGVIGLELLSVATGMLVASAGTKLLKPNASRVMKNGVLAGGLVGGLALFLAVGSYAIAGYELVLDLEAATFSGDINGVIELVSAAEKKEKDLAATKGRLRRLLGAIVGPLSQMPPTKKRLLYLRELARDQRFS